MSDWDSKQYLKFKNERTQPAIDLALHLKNVSAVSIIDIGCGPGNSTNVLKEISPNSNILDIDNSFDMKKEHDKSI